eukprot:INCI6764.2.p1 GENE.INCI6764.2~~INCI6764.2.p1  ORF type:complete len:587 (+),score=97.44 INCI6764.2:61-1761(+)
MAAVVADSVEDVRNATGPPQLPTPSSEELAEFNDLLNSQRTYTESAAIVKRTVSDLLKQGHVQRAIGYLQGESILLAYMKDEIILALIDECLENQQQIVFVALVPLVQTASKVNGMLSKAFDEAIGANNILKARFLSDIVAEFDVQLQRSFKTRLTNVDLMGKVWNYLEQRRFVEAFSHAQEIPSHSMHRLCRNACEKLIKDGALDVVAQQLLPYVNTTAWNGVFAISFLQTASTPSAIGVAAQNLIDCRPKQREWRPLELLQVLDHCARKWALLCRPDLYKVLRKHIRGLIPADVKSEEDAPPDHFLCPITTSLMSQPVRTTYGHTFERSAIAIWVSAHQTCPLTRQKLVLDQLEADNDLKVQIMAWRETNSHGELLTAVADVDRQIKVSTAAGLLHAADEERCLVILKSLPAGPRRVADLQTCVREALSVDDGKPKISRQTVVGVFGILQNPELEISSLLIVLCHLVQFDPRWSYRTTKYLLPTADEMSTYAPKHAIRYYFHAYFKGGEQDQIYGPAIVKDANLITKTMSSIECNKLRLELEMSGGMSNDHRLFPFRITGQEPL